MITGQLAQAGQPLKLSASEWNAVRQETIGRIGGDSVDLTSAIRFHHDDLVSVTQPLSIVAPTRPSDFERLGSRGGLLEVKYASPGEPWGIALKRKEAGTSSIGHMTFSGVHVMEITPAVATIGTSVGPVENEPYLDAGEGGIVLWASESPVIGTNHIGYVRIGASSGGGGSLQVRVRITEIGTGSQAGLYGFDQATYTAGVGGASTSSSTISLVGGVTGRLAGTAETNDLPLIDVNRFRGLPIGFVVTAQQETTPNGLRWFTDAARGIIPPFTSANRGQQLQISQDGNEMVWAHPSFVVDI